jgi:hypothetical protein
MKVSVVGMRSVICRVETVKERPLKAGRLNLFAGLNRLDEARDWS